MWDQLQHRLVCPACHTALHWEVSEKTGARIQEGRASCQTCHSDYPVHRGIGVFLSPLVRPADLWEGANRDVAAFLKNEPERVRALMEEPIESLNPTDQFVRGLVLEERKDFRRAKVAIDLATRGMYAASYWSAWQSQIRFVKRQLSHCQGPVVDIASGTGILLEAVISGSTEEFVGTDISPRVLMRDALVLGSLGLDERLSLLAFDAKQTPFADQSVPTLVTNVGFANIENPDALLSELRRIVADRLLAITLFYPEEEGANTEEIRRLKLDPLMFRSHALAQFEEAGFNVKVLNSQRARAEPTPRGQIMTEVQPDRLPAVGTDVELCTVVAT